MVPRAGSQLHWSGVDEGAVLVAHAVQVQLFWLIELSTGITSGAEKMMSAHWKYVCSIAEKRSRESDLL